MGKHPPLIRHLQKYLGKERVVLAPEELLTYGYDGSGGDYPPMAVVFPQSREEISEILKLAGESETPVIPRGAGSGMCGGALAVKGGVILALNRLNRIIEIDEKNQVAVVQPGVITGELQGEVARRALFYPPDPASRAFCTIGGNVACGAGGPSAVKYGVTRDYVIGLEAVLADGRIIRTGVRTAKGVVGYDLTRLLVGSEGTLAVISEITLRLIPQPPSRGTFLLLCRDLHLAATLVGELLKELTPSTLEYLDRTALNLVSALLPAAAKEGEVGAMLLLEFDGSPDQVAAQGEQLKKFLRRREGVKLEEAGNQRNAARLWAARRGISPASFQLRPHKFSDDVVVPRSLIPQLVACTENLADKSGLPIFTFGHAGDGNIHVNIMLDRDNPAELEAATGARDALYRRVLELGGTLSGEHGVGMRKSQAIAAELGPDALKLMRELKRVFDPKNILNPGKIFAEE